MYTLWIDAPEFENKGGWKLETQFVRAVGQSYLIACDIPGEPVNDAIAEFDVKENGRYRIFVRTKNWKYPEAPGRFNVIVDGKELPAVCGKMPTQSWYWEIAGDIELGCGKHTVSLHDLTGWLTRCAALIITDDMDFVPSPETERLQKQRRQIKGLPDEIHNCGEWDFVVVGAGPGGVPAAIAAARHGLKTALITGRPTVGGNASREGTIGLDGAGSRHLGFHETGIANEIKRIREYKSCTWQEAMEFLIANEENITVFCNELCIDANTVDGKINSATTINAITLEKSVFKGKMFADCSGDAWLGYYAGAAYRIGREAKWQYNEKFAPEDADTLTMSGCICAQPDPDKRKFRGYRAENTDNPVIFKAPDWAVKLPEGDELHRTPMGDAIDSPWWVENSNDFDDLWDDEFCRDQLVRIAVGYFDWVKNSWSGKEKCANYKLTGLALHNSKRENRRLMGVYVLNQNDFDGKTDFDDGVTYCGWAIDLHHPKGLFSGKEGPFYSNQNVPLTPIPFRCLYSKNIENLLMAGRCASVSHIALGSARVENTIATEGQVIGTAASVCIKNGITPRELYKTKMQQFRQLLLKDDVTVLGLKNEDKNDLAKSAAVTASSVSKTETVSLLPGTYDEWRPLTSPRICGPKGEFTKYSADYYKVELKNTTDTEQKITAKLVILNDSDKPNDYTVVQSNEITVVKGESIVCLPFDKTPENTSWAVLIYAAEGLYWRGRRPTNNKMHHFTVEGGRLVWQIDGCQLSFSDKVDITANADPGNVINGITRTTVNGLNAWVSDRKQKLPQSITLKLAEERLISTVQITADVDLAYPMYAFHYVPLADRTVKDLTVSVHNKDGWQDVGKVNGNFRRLIRVNFPPITSDAVRITVTDTLGVSYAKIYEVRVYE